MSDHKVTLETVEKILDHPNADRLDIVKLRKLEHMIISAKGNYEVGDEVLFIPDSCILSDEMVNHFDLTFLSNNMVKTIKIRGIHSQALILPLNMVCDYLGDDLMGVNFREDGFDFSDLLGIVRKIENNAGISKGKLPYGVKRYYLENPRIIFKQRSPKYLSNS